MVQPGDQPDFIRPDSFVYTKIFDAFIPGGGQSLQVGEFSSLHVLLGNIDGVTPLVATYQFVDSVSGFIVDSGVLSCHAVANNPNWPSWYLPVTADTFKLFANALAPIAVVVGTSRALAKGMAGAYQPIRTFQGTLAANAPAGTTVELLGVDTVLQSSLPQDDCSGYNGLVMYQWRSTITITGDLYLRYLDATAVERTQIVFQNFSTTINRLLSGHPDAFVRWRFISNAANGATASVLTLLLIPCDNPI